MPVYPGYVIAVAAAVLTGKPVKWIEDRMENLQADSFARDYHITAELAAQRRHPDGATHLTPLATMATPTRLPIRLNSRLDCSISVPARTTSKRPMSRSTAFTPTSTGRHCLSLLVPCHRGGAYHRTHGH